MTLGVGATGLPRTPEELGARLRRLRGRRSLRSLVDVQNTDPRFSMTLTKSQFQRYESGETLPPLQYAEDLDRLYDAAGWVDVALRSLWRSRWDPWAFDNAGPSRFHAALWPPQLAGTVWLKVKPTAQDADTVHLIEIEWGSWMRTVETLITAQGVLLITGKAANEDGIAHTCNIAIDKRVFVLHGAGNDFDEEVTVDIHRNWRPMPRENDDHHRPNT